MNYTYNGVNAMLNISSESGEHRNSSENGLKGSPTSKVLCFSSTIRDTTTGFGWL